MHNPGKGNGKAVLKYIFRCSLRVAEILQRMQNVAASDEKGGLKSPFFSYTRQKVPISSQADLQSVAEFC